MKTTIQPIQLDQSEILRILYVCMKDQRTLQKLPSGLNSGLLETFDFLGECLIEKIILQKVLEAHSIFYSEPIEAVGQFFDIASSNEKISAFDALEKLINEPQ